MEKPKHFKTGKGVVSNESAFYEGEALSLNTIYGEVVIFCSSKQEAVNIGNVLTANNPININEKEIQTVCLFSSNKVTEK